ncbi:hypothetical protein NKR23_g1345 [Pleurostoma richardsiae]|uniref:Uncharacterized protein n=1 Tax=Pleurostoma richardsiae TaxID=41990 RepID=A0AA38S5D1_9PEZI|nr:hypothetical protein NKR23_g1345 [Pleurostoma richardsiae]
MRPAASLPALGLLLSASLAAARQLAPMDFSPHRLSPRYYLEASPLDKRQDSGCRDGYHSCLDINSTACCADTTYCIVDPTTWLARCCALGSACDSPCSPDQYQCNATTTLAASTSTYAACCPRPCSSASFLCPASLGGGCCPFGGGCASGGRCLSTATPTATPLVSEVPAGCTTGQVACPASLGGGCCAAGRSCTLVTGAPFCASPTAVVSPTASGVSAVRQGGGGLSSGAKAGVGAGVAVGAAAVIAGLTWFCIRRRRERSSKASGSGPRSGNGGEGGLPSMGETSDGVSQAGRLAGPAGEYLGPEAVPGPFTDTLTTATSPGPMEHGVPADPHSPDDIVGAVEMDSGVEQEQPSTPESATQRLSVVHAVQMPDTIDGRFELYGSGMLTPTSQESIMRTPSDMTRRET